MRAIEVEVELINGFQRVFCPCSEPEYDDQIVKFDMVDDDGKTKQINLPLQNVAFWSEEEVK